MLAEALQNKDLSTTTTGFTDIHVEFDAQPSDIEGTSSTLALPLTITPRLATSRSSLTGYVVIL